MSQSNTQLQLLQRMQRRLVVFLVVVALAILVLVMRLASLQLASGDEFYEKSQRVIRKVVPLPAPRGEMFDRYYLSRNHAKPVVSNTVTLNLVAIPSYFKGNELIHKVAELEKLIKRPAGSLQEKVTATRIRQNEEIILIEDLSENELTLISDYFLRFSRFIVRQSSARYYNLEDKAAHITGYVGSPSHKDIQDGIRSYQLVGKNGLESVYDPILRGEDGEIVQIKTARGEVEEQKIFKNLVPGNNLILTIDAEMQQLAWDSLGDKTGAVVVIRPGSGEIMAMASKPGYNPNIMVSSDRELRNQHLREILGTKGELNRAISAKYPPASTFKPLVALAALEENRAEPNQHYFCNGKYILKSTYQGLSDSTYHCWSAHGDHDLVGALATSCSFYFYQMGYRIGAEPIIKYARYFMLDQKTNIDLPAEIEGFIPSPMWKEKYFNQRWFDGDTINLSIGQGYIETTLISMVNFFSALVTDGVVYKPHLVREVRFAENDEIKEKIQPEILYELPISDKSLKIIRKGLREVSVTGTASKIFSRPGLMAVAGKTGTAQTRSNDRFAQHSQHAWYIGYGPYDGPLDKTIVVGVFVEKGVGGAVGAAPIANNIFWLWSEKMRSKNKLE